MADFDPVALLRVLTSHHVDYVLVGGVAARLRGAPLLTQDVDITPDQNRRNLERLVEALDQLEARLRTASEPSGVAFPFDPDLIAGGSVWNLTTKYSDLDLVMTPAGFEGFAELTAGAGLVKVAVDPPLEIQVASLADIIRSKEAAGRTKDIAALPLLRLTQEELQTRPPANQE